MMPLLLSWAGLPPAEDLYGQLPAFVDVAEGAPTIIIASYSDTPVVFASDPEIAAKHDEGAEKQIIEQLRSLGYFDDQTRAEAAEAVAE
ncbi:MAG: hypothetical protein ACI8W3_003664 [Myxococcota bacterium]|jgi:hypothetical protein